MPIVNIGKCLNCEIKHEWLFDALTLKELRTIKDLTGMTQAAFKQAGADDDPEAMAVLLYVLHLRDDIRIPFEDIDLDFTNFSMVLTEQEQKDFDAAEAAAKKEAAKSGPKSPRSGRSVKAA